MKTIAEMLHLVEDAQMKDKLFSIYETYENLMMSLPASLRHHHIYPAGLHDHTQQTMHVALRIYSSLSQMGPIGCTQDEVIMMAFISSLDRIERYETFIEGDRVQFTNKNDLLVSPRLMIVAIVSSFGIVFEEKHLHALTFMTGNWKEDEFEFAGDTVSISSLASILRTAKALSINCFPVQGSITETPL